MKKIVIIPSRYESSRLKGKPLFLIKGKPMIQWVYERVSKAKNIDTVYIATNNIDIKNLVKSLGGRVVMTSSIHNSGTDRVAEAANIIGLKDEDIVINVQGDQPLVDARCFDELINPFFTNLNFEILTLAYPIKEPKLIDNPKDVKIVMDTHGYAIYFSRAEIPYDRDNKINFIKYKHLGIYAYRKKFLDIFSKLPTGSLENVEKLEQLRAIEYGHRILVKVSLYDSPEVDNIDDIKNIEESLGELL